MEPADYNFETMRRAISVMRAWASGDGDDTTLAFHEAQGIIDRDGGTDRLMSGFVNLTAALLVKLEADGRPMLETLQDIEDRFNPRS